MVGRISQDPRRYCKATTREGFICTRTVAHAGRHVAHGMAGEPLKIWRATFKVDEIAKVRAQIERLQAKLARLTSKRKP